MRQQSTGSALLAARMGAVTSLLLSRAGLTAAAAALALTTAACTSGSSGSGSGTTSAQRGNGAASGSPAASRTASGQPFGPGCAAVPAQGPGSFAGMSAAPVATAAAAEPQLSGLVRAVTAANLADSLNSQQNVTVFAPVDTAFQAIPADQLNALMADVPRLTAVLTHHVVQGRLSPGQLSGRHTTLDNDTVTVAGSGEKFTLSGAQTLNGKPATVVCGNVQTANATVYFVDQVLKPQATG